MPHYFTDGRYDDQRDDKFKKPQGGTPLFFVELLAATESRPVEQRLEVGSSSEGVPFDVVATFEE
jgi:hypothetical protein